MKEDKVDVAYEILSNMEWFNSLGMDREFVAAIIYCELEKMQIGETREVDGMKTEKVARKDFRFPTMKVAGSGIFFITDAVREILV